MTKDREQFDKVRDELKWAVGHLHAAVGNRLYGDGDDPRQEITGNGNAADEPLRLIASRIFDVMEAFDAVQVAMGWPAGEETRFAPFLRPPATLPSDVEPSLN